jgi:hypothetical protein
VFSFVRNSRYVTKYLSFQDIFSPAEKWLSKSGPQESASSQPRAGISAGIVQELQESAS